MASKDAKDTEEKAPKEKKEKTAKAPKEKKEKTAKAPKEEKEEKKGQAPKEKKAKKAKGPVEGQEPAVENQPGSGAEAQGKKNPAAAVTELLKGGGRLKKIWIAAAGVVLIGAGVFYFFILRDKGGAAEAAEAAAPKEKPQKYSVSFSPGDVKAIQDVDDKAAEPLFEVTVHSAKELNKDEKSAHGFDAVSSRLAALEVEIRLLDPSHEWNLYSRRVADAKGNWLDEVKSDNDASLLHAGLSDRETLYVKLPGDSPAGGETVSLSFYTASWNGKKNADGKCDIPVEPPAPLPKPSRPTNNAAPKSVDTAFGNWTGSAYTSAELNVSITLPEGWSNRPEATQADSTKKSTEASLARSDGKAALQITVDKQPKNTAEADQLALLSDVLAKTSGGYTVNPPAHRTIADKEFLGMSYSSSTEYYQVLLRKADNRLMEITLHFPLAEAAQADELLNCIKAMN